MYACNTLLDASRHHLHACSDRGTHRCVWRRRHVWRICGAAPVPSDPAGWCAWRLAESRSRASRIDLVGAWLETGTEPAANGCARTYTRRLPSSSNFTTCAELYTSTCLPCPRLCDPLTRSFLPSSLLPATARPSCAANLPRVISPPEQAAGGAAGWAAGGGASRLLPPPPPSPPPSLPPSATTTTTTATTSSFPEFRTQGDVKAA
jgi:hypothetical protein